MRHVLLSIACTLALAPAARADALGDALRTVASPIGVTAGKLDMNPLHSTELGNLINEAAEGHRVESVNILIVGKQGSQLHPAGVGKPPAASAFDLAKDPDMAFLAPVLAAASPTAWTLFELRALRPAFGKLGKVDAEVERVIFGYDFVVIIPDAKPAHPR